MDDYPDKYWYDLLLSKETPSQPLTSIEKSIIIEKSMHEAALQREYVRHCFGNRSPEECIVRMGYSLREDDRDLMAAFLYMGLMEPGSKTVWINTALITLVEDYMKIHMPRLISRRKMLREVVCWHELFHAIEESAPDIYTRNVKAEARFLGLIPYSRQVDAASEIGAVHFSKLMSGAVFSPYIYTQYLMAAANENLEVKHGH